MSNLVNERDTMSRAFMLLHFLLVAAVIVYKGGLAGVFIAGDNKGKVQAAGDTANMKVIGMFNDSVDNSDDGKGVNIKPGCYHLDNSATNAITEDHLFQPCYAEDDHTVSSDSGVNSVQAGIVIGIDADGVWVLVNPAALAGVALPAVPEAALVADPEACAALVAVLTGVDTGTDMTAAQAAAIISDLGKLKTAADNNKAASDAIIDALQAAGLMASA
jgi:hypothetical protein